MSSPGGRALDPPGTAGMPVRPDDGATAVERLTRRQRDVLRLMASGRSNHSIARQLSISEKAVVQHASHIYDALGLPVSVEDHRRVLAVLHYLSGDPSGDLDA